MFVIIPDSLFRMIAYDANNLDSLKNGTIYLSKPNKFNNPFNTNPYYNANNIWNRVKNGDLHQKLFNVLLKQEIHLKILMIYFYLNMK